MEAIALCNTKDLSHSEWLNKRKQGIGGSDVGAIMGFNKYKSALDVYIDKTTEEDSEQDISEAAYWGTALEDVVAKEFEKRSGKKIRKKNAILQHPKYPYMLANIDREVIGEKAILECKTASTYLAADWKDDEIPPSYILQVQHYLAVTGYDKAYIAVLIGGQKFLYKEIERDDELIDNIIKEIKEFWENCVLAKKPPQSVSVSKDTINRLFKIDNGKSINLDSVYNTDLETLQGLKNTIKRLEKEKEAIETKIKFALGDNQIGNTNSYIASWKNQSRKSVDMDKLKKEFRDAYEQCLKTSTVRVLRIKEI